MDLIGAIALTSGVSALVGGLWKAFHVISELERKIEDLGNESEKQELLINGVRERVEHTRTRLLREIQTNHERLSHCETWLTKNTAFDPR